MHRHRHLLLYAAAAALLAIFAVAAGVLSEPQFALPIVILAVLVLGFLAVNQLLARSVMKRHEGDSQAAQSDADEGLPSAHLIPDGTPLGATAEVHDELDVHDVPIDARNRREIERRAARR
jgi:hypothetical protein